MREPDSANYVDPPDLLCRFIPTPLRAVYRISSIRVIVETNDFTLLPVLPLDVTLDAPHEQSLLWQLVRDKDSHGLLEEPMLLTSGTLTTVTMGTACLFGLDQEARELLGFIGAEIDARTYHDFVVPFFCRMTDKALNGDPSPHFSRWSKESANV
jgi:hypothetical protein